MNKLNYICKVCGYLQEYEIEEWTICDCCGIEHGYQDIDKEDANLATINWIRQAFNWSLDEKRLLKGKEFSVWFDENKRPKDWNPLDQLNNIEIYLINKDVVESYKKEIPNIDVIIEKYL